jgi:hypothetical protein
MAKIPLLREFVRGVSAPRRRRLLAMRPAPVLVAKLALTTILFAALNQPPPAVHEDAAVTPGMARADKLINDEKAIIGRFMHPTGALDKIVCTKKKECETGEFFCVYAFHFDGGKYTSSLRFTFFEDGSLADIDVAGTTTWIKPFQAVDLAIAAAVHLVPQVGRSVTAALKDEPTKMLLEFWLRSRQAGTCKPSNGGMPFPRWHRRDSFSLHPTWPRFLRHVSQ